ncbi:hypothetical protein [Mycobacteroides abscessus]|uniref:hypothetical protein n=1 Tax=Mycobacteroides abscessus TaxID=36809 RepID=UPI00266F93D5|nr:hypothetical protein [Mycobacteroides abscessus]MDO3110423.1 hypothetical protein [Mycobacteroides abscessus subsp. abscessus]
MTRPNQPEPGPVARTLAWNVQRVRAETQQSHADLRQRLEELGHPVHRSWVSEVENCRRRVDVDDLVVLAAALRVSPATLLMPMSLVADDLVRQTPIGAHEARDYWEFLVAERPAFTRGDDPSDDDATLFRALSRPRWDQKLDENQEAGE